MIYAVHILYLIPALVLIHRDTRSREGVSVAVWIPTIWVARIASRSISSWIGFGGGESSLDGSPADAVLFFGLIFAAVVILSRRQIRYGQAIRENYALLLFYGFFFLSILWANSSLSSFKRYVKEFGNILMVVVLLSEVNPSEAIKAVFVRCAYLLIPLSVIYVRYLPSLGRRYSRSGGLEVIGVTDQKNTLGVMVLTCMLILVWDWLERRSSRRRTQSLDSFLLIILTAFSFYVLQQSGSKTSLLCLLIGSALLLAIRFEPLRKRVRKFGVYTLVVVILFFWLDSYVGVVEWLVAALGRDMTFTGRTDVWDVLLDAGTNPIIGDGFMSFWDNANFRANLPYWVAASAHNGYLEIYLAGGVIGVALLAFLLLNTAYRLNKALASETNFAIVRFAIFVVVLIGNFSESNFACMTPLGFLFLIAVLGGRPFTGMIANRHSVNEAGQRIARRSPAVHRTGEKSATGTL